MKILMMVLMVVLSGCNVDNDVSTEQRVSVISYDTVEFVESYSSIEYVVKILTDAPSAGYQMIIFTADNHFDLSFDVYNKATGNYINTITINSIDYDYGYVVNIDKL